MGKFVGKIAFWNERLAVLRLVRLADPLRFEAFRFERPDPFPKKIPPWTVPAWSTETFAIPEMLIEL